MKNNPWGLSPAHCKTMEALIEYGNDKAAARVLHVEPSTVEARNKVVRDKMALVVGKPVSRLQAAVLFDRLVREGQ